MIDPEKYLTTLSERNPDLYFLEIGAMDGKSFDLLHSFIKRYGWRGILVEPLPDLFAELTATYADCEGLILENIAIANEVGTRTMYRILPDTIRKEKLPGWAKGISSLYPDRNAIGGMNGLLNGHVLSEKFYARLKQHIVEQQVPCMPLADLLEKNQVDRIDVLQIDTEGYDYQIFRQFDLDRYSPQFIKVEVGNLIPQEFEAIKTTLDTHGYEHEIRGLDVLAWK